MTKILHATILGLGLVAGAAFSAQAQSVSALPPGPDAAPQGQTARTMPFGSTQGVFPKPGGSQVITEQPSPVYAGNQNAVPTSQPTAAKPAPGTYSGGLGLRPN